MKRKIIGLTLILMTAFGFQFFGGRNLLTTETQASAASFKEKSVLAFKVKDIDGKDVKLNRYKGKVALIVNTASKCGNTPQYEGLEKIYSKYKDQDFVILGFPANNFNGQEPGTDAEIKEFCTLKYNVSFPMFSKISVKGSDQAPIYKFLTSKETNPEFAGDVTWNFEKFLIDREGKIAARFSPRTQPDSEEVVKAIEKLLAAKN